MIRIQQIASPISRHHDQRETLIGLRLNKIGRISDRPFDGPNWGMIQKVRHLIRLPHEELFEEHRLVPPQPEDEAADLALMRRLVFKDDRIVLEFFSAEEKRGRKTPDCKLMKDGHLAGYCELKSPRDDWVFRVPDDLKPGEIRQEVRRDPAAYNLARNIGKAAAQFDSVNPEHRLPNILVLVSHARRRDAVDLHMAIGGIKMPDGSRRFLLEDPNEKVWKMAWEKQQQLWDAARRIDVFFWIDAHKESCTHIVNLDAPRHKEACDLLGLQIA